MRLLKSLYLSLACFFMLSASTFAAQDVLLPLPFENLSGRTEYQWISESFPLIFAELLDSPGLAVLTAEERKAGFERLGFRSHDLLTRAAEIRLAEATQANLVLTGNFDINSDTKGITIAITAALVDIREGRKKPFNFSGPLADLQTMQGLLAWSILYDRDPALPYSQEQLKRRAKLIPARSFEFFVKGMQTNDEKSREIFLKRAIKEFNEVESVGHYAHAIYELGLSKYRQQDFTAAVQHFKELLKDDPHYPESLFYLGLAYKAKGQLAEATDTFDKLASSLPLIEFLNNAGASQIAKGDLNRAMWFLQRAAASAQQDNLVRFNYGYALWRYKSYDQAATELKAAVLANPKDGEAHYLLAKALNAAGRKTEAEQADQDARRVFANYARWEVAPEKIPLLVRYKEEFDRVNFHKLVRPQGSATNLPAAQTRLARESLERARQFAANKNDPDALAELHKVLSNDPTLADAHYLRGQIMQRANNLETALSAYSAAVYWNPRLTAAHTALGQIYLQRGDRARALSHSKLALEIDPLDRAALTLKQQIEGGK